MKQLPRVLLTLSALALLTRATSAATPPLCLSLPCEISHVHDGDTVTVTITITANVRFLNCWAPELSQPGGQQSLDNIRMMTGRHGRVLIPMTDDIKNVSQLLTLGRVLGEVWVDGDDESLSAYQVRTSHAASRKDLPLGQ